MYPQAIGKHNMSSVSLLNCCYDCDHNANAVRCYEDVPLKHKHAKQDVRMLGITLQFSSSFWMKNASCFPFSRLTEVILHARVLLETGTLESKQISL